MHYANGRIRSTFPGFHEINSLPGDSPIAVGGDLQPDRLLQAYRHGIFPWFSENDPILWWSPDPRCVLEPQHYHVPRRQQRVLRRFTIRTDGNFEQVIRACAKPRKNESGTWLHEAMINAYMQLHRQGHADAVAVYADGELAGGVYGVRLGEIFFGESMFSVVSGASRAALAFLSGTLGNHAPPCRLIDCQVPSAHLHRLGARTIPRTVFQQRLQALLPS